MIKLPRKFRSGLHGLVQLCSNASRVIYSFRSVQRRLTIHYAIGGSLGMVAGSQLNFDIPDGPYKIGLGCFILAITFIPSPRQLSRPIGKWFGVGFFTTLLSLFVGATGPLIAPFYLNEKMAKETLVATKAACQLFTHFFKVTVFFVAGFEIGEHGLLLVAMIIAVIVGNAIGKALLNRVAETWFFHIFKGLIVVLCARMIVIGLLSL